MPISRTLLIVIIAIIVIAAVGGGLAYYYTQQRKPQKIVIYVIGKGVHPYWDVVAAGVEKAEQEIKQKFGVDIDAEFWTPTKEEAALQFSQVDALIAQKITGLALAPVDAEAAVTYINKAIQQGIITITFDTDAPGSNRPIYIGTDNYKAGYLGGLAAYTLAKQKGYVKAGATLKVGIISATLAAQNARERVQGFMDAIKKCAEVDPDIKGNINIQFIGPYEDKGDVSAAVSYALSILQAHPDLHIAFGSNAYEGPAWTQALKQLNYPPGKVVLVQFDVTSDNVPPAWEGYALVTIGQRQYFMGYYAVWLIYNATRLGSIEQAIKQFMPQWPQVKAYDTGVDLVAKERLELTAPTGEKIVIKSLSEYKREMQGLGVDPKLLGLENIP
ncbi:MAG: substrate-binding domain-containing protein [Thaumarchaeota archaeon]|jgi:ribose transport system substrate-binding protein|nr:substrate-binding domain-containing protein [Candidatus Geocrenenecus arthurdayi]